MPPSRQAERRGRLWLELLQRLMRLLLSVSVLGHLCMETSVGCLRKETCRAASPGLSLVLLILGRKQVLAVCVSVCVCWGEGEVPTHTWGFDGAPLCGVETRGMCWLCKVQRHHQLHLWHQSYSAQQNPNSCSIWTPSFCRYYVHSNAVGGAWWAYYHTDKCGWHMMNGCVEGLETKHYSFYGSIDALANYCTVL